MAKIRHIAVFAREQEKLADFYKTVFDMKEVHRHYAEGSSDKQAIYLSDGYINLAILPAGADYPEGIDHFGFEVEDSKETAALALRSGASQGRESVPRDGRFAEGFIRDPVGQRVDLSVQGWRTEAVEPVATGKEKATIPGHN